MVVVGGSPTGGRRLRIASGETRQDVAVRPTDIGVLPDMPTVPVTPRGHPPEIWADTLADIPRIGLADLAARLGTSTGAHLVVISAHPDDETLGAGRLVSAWVRNIGPVSAVLATAGEACLDHLGRRPEQLAARRLAEWRAATQRLGITATRTLDLPDAQLASREADLTRLLDAAIGDLLAPAGSGPADSARLRNARLGSPGARRGEHRYRPTVLAAPSRRDPHPDHAAVGRAAATTAAARELPVLGYPVWLTYWSTPAEVASGPEKLAHLLTDERAETDRAAACAEFPSQLAPLAPDLEPVVPPAMLAALDRQLLLLDREG